MNRYNDLNFPSFELSLALRQSGVLRKWKPEDDWEWWWYCYSDVEPQIFSIAEIMEQVDGFYPYCIWQAIPCPSLGEMMDYLRENGWVEWFETSPLKWCFCDKDNNTTISSADTAPNACAKGLTCLLQQRG